MTAAASAADPLQTLLSQPLVGIIGAVTTSGGEGEQIMSRWGLILAAVAIGVGVVAAESLLFTLLTGRPLIFATDVEPVNATLIAIPYLALAVAGARRLLPWLVGLGLTLSLWGYALYSGVSYQWNPDGSGANIGLGLFMLASPLIFTPIVLSVHAAQGRTRAGT